MLIALTGYHIFYSIPLIVAVSLVYSATRHERSGPILQHAVRFAAWIVAFMVIVMGVLKFLEWLI